MTKKQKQTEVMKFINIMQPKLFLHDWKIEVLIIEKPHHKGDHIAADVAPDPIYKHATIRVFPSHWESDQDDRMHNLLHEMVHLIIEPLNHLIYCARNGEAITPQDQERTLERTVQHVTDSLFHLN